MATKDVSVKAGEVWRTMADEDKLKYEIKAATDKKRYQDERSSPMSSASSRACWTFSTCRA